MGSYIDQKPFSLATLLRPDLKDLKPYTAQSMDQVIRLDANENPFDLPGEIKAAIESQLSTAMFARYPDPLARDLLKDIAAYTKVPVECLLVGNGSDELILNIMLAFGMGRTVLIATPTFSMYKIHGQIAGALCQGVARKQDFQPDVLQLLQEAAQTKAAIIVLCTPNNPTGNATPLEQIETLVTNTSALVVVDEAYIEFGGTSCAALIEQYPNLIVLRTFSKAFGLAGLRVGYLMASPLVINELLRIKQPFNVNQYSQLAAQMVLQHRDLLLAQVGQILENRKILEKNMTAIKGLTLYPTQTNFILFRTSLPANTVYEGLLAQGVLIRNVSGLALENCLRVTVGTREENSYFLEKLKTVLAKNG